MTHARLLRIAAIVTLIGVVGLGLALSRTEPSRAGALGGPVIIGGDDLTDHGSVDGGGNVVEGWLYIRRALESIGPNVSRGDGSIAALGSAASAETNSGDAGAGIGAAAQEVGRSVTYYDGDAAMTQFFVDLAGGGANPSIIWIAGTGAGNDLDGTEPAVLTTNAAAIASFVASGGGLMSHGTEFGWLTALLPGAVAVGGGSSGDLYFTPAGTTALGALTTGDINAGPWHNYFEGDFGGLDVLVRSSSVDDSTSQDAAVILGGAQVTFEEQPTTVPEEEDTSDCLPGVPGLPCGDQAGGGDPGDFQPNATPVGSDTPVVPVPTVAEPTTAPPAPATPAPSGGRAGIITAPDTGTGDGTTSAGAGGWLVVALGLALAGGTAVLAGRRMRV